MMPSGQPSASAVPTPSKSPAGGAARTSTRFKKGDRRPRGQGGATRVQNDIAVERAQGLSQAATARLLGVSKQYVSHVEAMPHIQARIQELRETWTRIAHEKITGYAETAWTMAGEAAEQRDARAFDSTVRGLVGMEKISASVAGVAQQVQVSGMPAPVVDLKVLIQNLIAHDGSRVAST